LQEPLGTGGDAVERIAYDLQIAAPRLSDHEALALAVEQLHAQLGLERLDLMADGALRHAQLLGCAREALVAGRRLESLERIQRRQMARHKHPRS
jgi:hypothetical protein